tara:strand:+ start:227 stop:502 length:276 start_codon:yes stop_codon:yes gene_type:complete
MSTRKLTVLNEWEVDEEGTNVPKIVNDYLHKDWNYKQIDASGQDTVPPTPNSVVTIVICDDEMANDLNANPDVIILTDDEYNPSEPMHQLP